MHTVRFEIAGDVGAGQPQISGCGGQIRGAARGQQVQPEFGIVGSCGTAVVRREFERQLAAGEDLEDLGQCELPGRRRLCCVFPECGHRRCTALAYRSSSRESGS